MKENIAGIRKTYSRKKLLEKKAAADPITQFGKWWKQALKAGIEEVNAMTLATASADGMPAARIVLLKDFALPSLLIMPALKGSNLLKTPGPVWYSSGKNWKDRYVLPVWWRSWNPKPAVSILIPGPGKVR